MDKSERPMRLRKHKCVWRPFSGTGIPLRAGCPQRVNHMRRSKDNSDGSALHQNRINLHCPLTMLEGSSLLDTSQEALTREDSSEFTDDDSIEDEDHLFDDPFVKDAFGNLTDWRLSELNVEFSKILEKKSSEQKQKEKKLSKEEKLKMYNDCMKQYMKISLEKYNEEQDLSEAMCFEFIEIIRESSMVEEDFKIYQHFNFMAKQICSTVRLFFAEVIPDGDNCEVTCCKPLVDGDNGHCFGCKNQGDADLRHPSDDKIYVGGHEDCVCPFSIDSESEDDDSD
ncbi:hypothetical protein ACP4OV_004062 [Aristida adscensionis]